MSAPDTETEAVERLVHDCDLAAGALRRSPSVRSILQDSSKTLRALKHERDELALVIMGGEDAPGLAASLSLEELQKLQLDNQASAKAFYEYDLSQAREHAQEMVEALSRLVVVYKDMEDGNGDPCPDIEAARALLALITPPTKGE